MPHISCLNGHEIEIQANQFGQRIACPMCQLMMVVSPPRAGEAVLPKYEVLCDNGHVLRVKSKYLGTQIRCPQCQGLAWVTTDRLQRNTPQATPKPALPVVLAESFAPPVRRATPVVVAAPVVPVASLDDIPVAEVDETAARPAKPRLTYEDDDDKAEEDEGELSKAERRHLKLTDQGLGYWQASVIGYLSIFLVTTILSFLFSAIAQGVSSFEAQGNLWRVYEVLGWIIIIALLLNTLLCLAGKVLTLFTPWRTGATVWFMLSMVVLICFVGFRVFLLIQESIWTKTLMAYLFGVYLSGKPYYFINESLFLIMWLLMVMGLWQLGKFARKPMVRQRVMLLGLLGLGCWVVLVFVPIISEFFPVSSMVALWVVVTSKLLFTLGMGGLMIFQHLSVVSEVRLTLGRLK